MKLLIVTQSVDRRNPILGFFHRWIEEFANNFDFVTVICLEKGEYNLPHNVRVFSLGKEKGKIKIKYIFNFYRYIWSERRNYDVVFVHMNPIYVILGWLVWKIQKKKTSLWYTHKNVDLKLHLALKLVDDVFTASELSFRLKSSKVHVLGHGIDTELFNIRNTQKSNIILAVGRISNTKRVLEMLPIINTIPEYKLQIIGSPANNDDESYLKKLKHKISDLGLTQKVDFVGDISQSDMPGYYNNAKAMINLSSTGSLDKVVLEAMASGLPVVTTNEAFSEGFSGINMYVPRGDMVVSTVLDVIHMSQEDLDRLSLKEREIIVTRHNLPILIKKISNIITK